MESIKFIKGEETGVVIVRDDFANSWLSDQFSAALHVVDRICTEQQSNILINQDKDESCRVPFNASNIVAFCGDRGEGKTSCMMTVRVILSDESVREKYYQNKTNKPNFPLFETISLIEPAFFDKDHNIIELLLGQMFIQFNKHQRKEVDYEKSLCLRNKVREAFCKVQGNLSILHSSSKNPYESLENLESLAASMQLAESLKELFSIYLQYMDKKDGRLLICIDDIDLNMSEAYLLSEQIRKYLSNEYCVILLALKVEQLQNVITSHIKKEDGRCMGSVIYQTMAEKYITKFLPIQNRIEMPRVLLLADKELVLCPKEIELENKISVKETVMTLIANKTHYLFYNTKGGVSPIIPRNLRALRHLIGILTEMKDYDSSKKNEHKDSLDEQNQYNQQVFRHYLYNVWAKVMSEKDKKFVEELLSISNSHTINKYVCSYLRIRFKDWLEVNVFGDEKKKERNSTLEEQVVLKRNTRLLLKNILEGDNVASNVSAGDVLYVESILSRSIADEDSVNLLFFIRSYYSIQLYEYYNRITEREGMLYPEPIENKEIDQQDAWMTHTNDYQRFINGSVFTFAAGEIIPAFAQVKAYRDMWQVDSLTLFKKMKEAITSIKTNEKESQSVKLFQRCEYLLLSTIYSSSDIVDNTNLVVNRKQSKTNYASEFYHGVGRSYLVFNPLAIFSNCANIQYTYNRMGVLGEGEKTFFEYALENKESLLNKMISSVDDQYKDAKEPVDIQVYLRSLASNAIIRNVDVHHSMLDRIQNRRDDMTRQGESTLSIPLCKFYEYIIKDTKINYYEKKNDRYMHSTFVFLKPVVEFLKNETDKSLMLKKTGKDKKSSDAEEQSKYGYQKFLSFFPGLENHIKDTSCSREDILTYLVKNDNKDIYKTYKEIIDKGFSKDNYDAKTLKNAIVTICKRINRQNEK